MSEPRDAIEEIVEPFLIQQGFVQRTPRGRLLTPNAFRHLGLEAPAAQAAQFTLFGGGGGIGVIRSSRTAYNGRALLRSPSGVD